MRSLLPLLMALFGCGDSSGSVRFVTWGEDYIEQGIPRAQAGETIVEDGYTIKYEKFLINLGNIRVVDTSGNVGAELTGFRLVDQTKVGRKALSTTLELPAQAWTQVSYEIAPATSRTEVAGATEEDKARMLQGGFSLYVEGSLQKDAEQKRFAWGFTSHTLFDRCKSRNQDGKPLTDGFMVKSGSISVIELTIHGDHFFYDDLQSPSAKIRGANIAAADANGDGLITLDELAKKKLATIPAEAGKYGTGSASGVNDLAAFVTALGRTVGHFRGEGECVATASR
jgi:hypothetical protein